MGYAARLGEEFDPYKLPVAELVEKVNPVEQIFSIIMGVVLLIVLAWFADRSAYGWTQMNGLFQNPVLEQYIPWIALSFLAGWRDCVRQ